MKIPSKKGSSNDFQTPVEALLPLLPFLKKEWTIWECASGKGNLVKGLVDRGYKVVESDILTGGDYLLSEPDHWDCAVTNPPYSIKQDFLERAYMLGKPFAFLLPLTTFETKKRQSLFKKYGLEVIFFDRRINFETPSGRGSGSWFSTAWFSNGLNIGKQMTFVELSKNI